MSNPNNPNPGGTGDSSMSKIVPANVKVSSPKMSRGQGPMPGGRFKETVANTFVPARRKKAR
jgi:hypothetical protein